MRRRPGLQGLQQTAANRQQLRALGERVEEANISVMRAQMATFKAALEQFAANHREEIRKNPEFRQQFHAMCASINVDPLVSNKGGTWAQKLGLGDFYYALAVTVLDVCRARRQYDGGLTELAVVHRHVSRRRGGAADPINEDDIVRALQKLSVLGGGLGVITVGGRRFVRSVPAELSTDANAILELAGVLGGFFQRTDVASNLGWGEERTSDALTALAREGLILVDDPPDVPAEHPAHRMYWCPAVGMEEAVEEYQRREGLTVTGFRGLKARADEDEEYRVE